MGQGMVQGQPSQPGGPGQMGPGQMGPGQMGPGQNGPAARGQGPRAGGPGEPAMAGQQIERLLGLTDDQRAKFNAVMRGMSDQSAPIADELEFTRRALHREAFADKRDDAKIATLSSKVVALEKQLLDIHVKGKTTLSEALTPDQRQVLRMHADVLSEPGAARGARGRGRGRG